MDDAFLRQQAVTHSLNGRPIVENLDICPANILYMIANVELRLDRVLLRVELDECVMTPVCSLVSIAQLSSV